MTDHVNVSVSRTRQPPWAIVACALVASLLGCTAESADDAGAAMRGGKAEGQGCETMREWLGPLFSPPDRDEPWCFETKGEVVYFAAIESDAFASGPPRSIDLTDALFPGDAGHACFYPKRHLRGTTGGQFGLVVEFNPCGSDPKAATEVAFDDHDGYACGEFGCGEDDDDGNYGEPIDGP